MLTRTTSQKLRFVRHCLLLLLLCVTAGGAQQPPTPQASPNADLYRSFVGEWEGLDKNPEDGEIPVHISITAEPLKQRMRWVTVYGHKTFFRFARATRYFSFSPSRDTLIIEVRGSGTQYYHCDGVDSIMTGNKLGFTAFSINLNPYGHIFLLNMAVDENSLAYDWQTSTDKVHFQFYGSFKLKRVAFSKAPWMK